MKLIEITLEDIKEYLNRISDYMFRTEWEYNDSAKVLKIYRFSGTYDDYIYICSICKTSDGDFEIETQCGDGYFNFGEGFFDYEEDEVTVPYITNLLLMEAKIQFGEELDFWKSQIKFINDFAKKAGQEPVKVYTCANNVY